jgi:DNA polymerase epsilon subunit 1
MHNLKRPRLLPDSSNSADLTPRPTQLPIRALSDDKDEKIILGKDFEKPLKRQIAGLIRCQKEELVHPELATDYTFPLLPGSHLTLSNPAFQLVKSLMQVLSLDKNITLEARLLRKGLLAMFEVREFSADAQFRNPSTSLRYQQVICDNCTMARDLDLCRDEDLIPDVDAAGKAVVDAAATRPWRCGFCGAEYDRLALEERMIAQVQGMIVEWSTQDLKCGKCRAVRVNDFMEHCACAGEWTGTVERGEVLAKLGVFRQVARFYGLRMLDDVVEGVWEGL